MCQPLSSRCYYCTIVKDSVWSDYTSIWEGMSAGQSDCRNRCLWLLHPIDRGDKVENKLLFDLLLITNFSNPLETWPIDVETPERKDVCHSWQKVFDKRQTTLVQRQCQWRVLWRHCPETISKHNVHQKVLQYTACSEAPSAHAGLPDFQVQPTDCSRWHHIPHIPHMHKKLANLTRSCISFMIVQ